MTYTVQHFNEQLESGPYAWPGGYPVYFITSDGEALSFAAARAEADNIRESVASGYNDGWRVVAAEINWEDASLYCAHTNNRIESAYAEDDASED